MIIIEELGNVDTGLIDKRYGTKVFRKSALFECPECKKHFVVRRDKGIKQSTCKDCRGVTLTSHGHSRQLYYYVWQSMKDRCINPKNPKYHIYGGKGITIQESWLSFEGFWKDNEHLYQPGLTIDRKDSSKGYNVENVRWISSKQNSSETTKRRPVNQYRIILTPVKGEEFIKTWESAKNAADTLGLIASAITQVCSTNPSNSKYKTHGGFIWKYAQ